VITRLAGILRRNTLRANRSEGDGGFSLPELIVGMGMMTVTATVFMSAVTSMSVDVRKQASLADALTGNRIAYQLLDKQVRYADEIEAPTDGVGTDAAPIAKNDGKGYYEYVEWHTTLNSTTSTCTQWRLDSELDRLQWRLATLNTTLASSTTPGSWNTVATGAVNNIAPSLVGTAGFQPAFTIPTKTSDQTLQQISFLFVTQHGGAASLGNSTSRFVFTATNSALTLGATPATNQCVGSTYGLDHSSS
jgi:type II secretory pathway pseudopilin PulG